MACHSNRTAFLHLSMWLSMVVILTFCQPARISSQSPQHIDVETRMGRITGSILKTLKGSDIYSFRGIYYAQSPANENRFKEPQPTKAWTVSTFDATKDGYICPQPDIEEKLISEDCLLLNVFSKNLTGNADVMVYIHGGGNIAGSCHSELKSGPEYLLDQDIVLVTINYRLGALGFLSTQTKEAMGNYGYLDQVLALKWIQKHIASFGGNQNSVTIFGLSAGGMSVSLHMASPLSAGLFHRAIVMSGSATSHHHIENVVLTRKLARATACPMYNPKDLLECLRKVHWKTIIDVCSTWEFYGFPHLRWNYEVDGHFLMETPSKIFAQGLFNRVNLITGMTKDEFTFCVYDQEHNTGLLNDMSDHFEKYAPELFGFNPQHSEAKNISNRIKKFYLHNQKIGRENLLDFGRIFCDAIIGHGIHRLVHLARRYVNVYYYRLDYVGAFSNSLDSSGQPRGVFHADDELYILKSRVSNHTIKVTDPDIFMVDRITSWWASFAKTGIPARISNVEWLPCNSTHMHTMYNDKEVRINSEPFSDRFALWDSLFP